MERKAIHTLLLFVLVAGAVTITNAYAQSNTDRLTEVVENTENTNNMLNAFTEVWNGIADTLDNIVSLVESVSTNVSSISNNMATSDDVATLDGDIMELETTVSGIQDAVEASDAARETDSVFYEDTITDTITRTKTMLSQLESMQSADGDANIVGINTRINTLLNDQQNVADRLSKIEANLGIIQETVDAPSDTTLAALDESSTKIEVKYLDFAKTGNDAAMNREYKISYNFSCDSDVFLSDVTTYNAFNPNAEDTSAAMTTIKIGTDLAYDDQFVAREISEGQTIQQLNRTLSLNNEKLLKDSQLLVEFTTTHPSGDVDTSADDPVTVYTLSSTIVSNATLNALPELQHHFKNITANDRKAVTEATVLRATIDWFSDNENTKCKYTDVREAAGLPDSDVVIVFLDVKDGEEGLIRALDPETVDCNLETVMINTVTAEFFGDVQFPQHSSLTLKKVGSTSPEVVFEFAANGTITSDVGKLPFTITGSDLMVEGKISTGDSLAVNIAYNTIADNECSVQE